MKLTSKCAVAVLLAGVWTPSAHARDCGEVYWSPCTYGSHAVLAFSQQLKGAHGSCMWCLTDFGTHRVWIHPSGRRIQVKTRGDRELLPVYVKDAARALFEEEKCPDTK